MDNADSSASDGSKKGGLVKGVIAVVVIAIAIVAGYWVYTHPSVHIVNAGAADSISVFIDDVQVAGGVKLAKTEDEARSNSATASVKAGEHTISAKDASGKVIDTQKVDITGGGSFLYAPAHSPKVCFTLQTDAYGKAKVEDPFVALDPTKSFWKLPSGPDFWFRDTPDKVKGKKGGSKKSALRQHECGDDSFE